MDQKHAMLYPPIDDDAANAMPHDQRVSASTSIGLPVEAPPSYDAAMFAEQLNANSPSKNNAQTVMTPAGWLPNPADSTPIIIVQPQPVTQPSHHGRRRNRSPRKEKHQQRSVQITTTTNWQQPQQQQQQQQQPAQTQPPQINYQPQNLLPTVTLTTVQSAPPQRPKLGPHPCAVACTVCGTCQTTKMSYTPSTRTHVSALLLCLVGWCVGACFVPYCMDSCRTGNHYCSKCNTFLGTYNPRHANK